MNKKVLKTMIALVAVFLCGLYVVKIFFPEQFIMVIENERLVMIGEYVDQNLWLYITIACVTNFITYWMYLGAVTRKWRLNWKEILAVVVTIALTQTLYSFESTITLASGVATVSMLILPCLSGARLQDVALVFTFDYFSQILSLLIRNLPALLVSVNFMTAFLMTLESYFWLLLFYLCFNMKKEKEYGKT